ncbi:alpha/beta fold hydrolase [Phytohabitans houttuyneae]|uniref:Hydrolase n=1 Tax=Phytohabitans houttuyneae TaxID=1076126 RepID=A0A6V8KCS5_9ACTN|nr:alpha/beta hydrolase [Phytohabitans houttuyneae]GFJ83033.1 hydrolase [Phytohabitans houttuyneae]
MTTTTATHTLQVSDGTLYFEIRGDGPLVALVGSPMDADAFAPLADALAADHMVLTADPRGIGRSPLADPELDSTPPLRAGDLAALLRHAGGGPAAVFGTSGGACTVLALAQAHPEAVHTVVAHEPPLAELLPDRDALAAGTDDMIATYLAGDPLGAWRAFMAQAGIDLPEDVLEAMFGGERDPRRAADERRFFAHEVRASTFWRPDLAALRGGGARITVGIGEESAGQLCDRASRALAEALAVEPVLFPGDHTGFVDAPDAFAARLSSLLGPPA